MSPCLFNSYAEYIMQNARLDEAQAGIKIAGRNINNLRYADDATLTSVRPPPAPPYLVRVLVNLLTETFHHPPKICLKLHFDLFTATHIEQS